MAGVADASDRRAFDSKDLWQTPVLGPLGTVYDSGPTALNPDGTRWYGDDDRTCDWIDRAGRDGRINDGVVVCSADGSHMWSATIGYDFEWARRPSRPMARCSSPAD